MDAVQLQELNIRDLVTEHNVLAAMSDGEAKPLKAWKRGKDKLIERMVTLDEKYGIKKETKTIRQTAIDLLCATDFYEDRDKKSDPDNMSQNKKAFDGVHHPHTNPKGRGRSVGFPYDAIIHSIKEEFPECNTTVACLRWYAVKIRAEEFGYEGLELPQRRPRAKPKSRRG